MKESNYGTLYSINCSYTKDYRCNKDVPFLYSNDASNYFYGCGLSPNIPKIPKVYSFAANSNPQLDIHDPVIYREYNFAEIFKSPLTIKDCNIHFRDSCKIFAQDSIITAPMNLKKSAKLIDTNYYNSNTIVYNNKTINPGDIVKININNLSPMVEVEKYLSEINPSKVILNITTSSNLDLKLFNNVENLVILGNGNRLNVQCYEINEKMSLTVINATFQSYKADWVFKNNGALTFINCTFTDNSKCNFIINEGACTFINCSVLNNKNRDDFIDNKGALIIQNSTFLNNKHNRGVIYNQAILCIINSTFKDNSNVDLYDYNAGNYAIINSSCKTKYTIPEKPRKPTFLEKIMGIFCIVVGVLGVALGVATLFVCPLCSAFFIPIGVLSIAGGVYLTIQAWKNSDSEYTSYADYLNTDNKVNKAMIESYIMSDFSKEFGCKLGYNLHINTIIQSYDELYSIIKSSINPWNNEINVHTFETGNNIGLGKRMLFKYGPLTPFIISKQ